MKRKQLIKRLQKSYRTGKLKRPRFHFPEHPLMLALKAFRFLLEGTIIMFKGMTEAHQRSPEEGNRYFEVLQDHGLFQMHSDVANRLQQGINKHLNKLEG